MLGTPPVRSAWCDPRWGTKGGVEELGYLVLALLAAGIGTLGGLGGAILLVPALIVVGVDASEAAPLGLITVAAASVAAGPRQLEERTVNHRIGVTTELMASSGAVAGAIVSGAVSDRVLTYVLAAVALLAAAAGVNRSGLRNPPDPEADLRDVGERVAALSGAYPVSDDEIAPYTTRRVPLALGFMTVAGLIAGLAGASGGFIKTPATSEIMHVPTRVAAATTTFTVGVTSAAALIVFAIQGRIDPSLASSVILGALAGGQLGAGLQSRVSGPVIRKALSVVLVVVAGVLVVRA